MLPREGGGHDELFIMGLTGNCTAGPTIEDDISLIGASPGRNALSTADGSLGNRE